MKKRAFTALVVFALAACGGGSSSGPSGAVLPAAKQSTALLTVSIPAKSTAGRALRYVSPNAQSLTVAVNGAAPAATANITPGSGGCTTSGGATTCQVSVTAPVGNDTFAIVLYSGTNGSGSALASSTVTADISASGSTPLNVTLNGVVSTIAILLATNAPPIGTPASIPVTVVAKDASGATIISPGAYAPAIALTNSDTSGHATLSTTTVNDPSVAVTLNYDGSAALKSATISASVAGTITSVTPAVL
ncbi:MAG TPA: hypothetical protein VIO32_08680, partial [Candidatus Baltobacteraceae bacterium]